VSVQKLFEVDVGGKVRARLPRRFHRVGTDSGRAHSGANRLGLAKRCGGKQPQPCKQQQSTQNRRRKHLEALRFENFWRDDRAEFVLFFARPGKFLFVGKAAAYFAHTAVAAWRSISVLRLSRRLAAAYCLLLLHLGPGVLERYRSVEDQSSRPGVAIDAEIAQALKLVARTFPRIFQRWFKLRCLHH